MNWFKKLFKSNRNEERINSIERDHERLLNDFMAHKTETERQLSYHSKNAHAEVNERIDSIRERFDNMLESTVESLEARLKNLEDLVEEESALDQSVEVLKKMVDKHSKQIQRVEDRIGKNELMHVETDKTLNESFQSAMKSVTREASQFKKFAVKLAIDLANEKIKEIDEHWLDAIDEIKFTSLLKKDDQPTLEEIPNNVDDLKRESSNLEPEDHSSFFTIFVNDEEKKIDQSVLNFEEIVELAFPEESNLPGSNIDLYAAYEVTYNTLKGTRIMLSGGLSDDAIEVFDGMVISVESIF
jgi:exonuclease VII large subunit